MEKKQIYINARFLTQPITGVQRFAIELVKELLKVSNLEIYFVAPQNIIHTDLAEEWGVISFGKYNSHLWEQLELPFFLKKKGYPLLLCLCNTGPLFYRRNIITIHDLAFLENPKWFSIYFRLFYSLLVPRLALKALHILTVSEFSKKELIQKINLPKEKISVVYNAVNHLSTTFTDAKKKDFFLMVGSLDPRKNIDRVLEAFSSKELQNINLKIVGGSAHNFNAIQDHSNKKSKNIEFLGRVSDQELQTLYTQARGFIYPSLYEGFGIPPVEALYYNVLPIVSDIEVFHEILGESVIYIDPYDVEKIKNQISDFIAKDMDETRLADSKEFVKKYSWRKSAILLDDILKIRYLKDDHI